MTIMQQAIGAAVQDALAHEDPVDRVAGVLLMAFGFNAAEQGEPLSRRPDDLQGRARRAARAAMDAFYTPEGIAR